MRRTRFCTACLAAALPAVCAALALNPAARASMSYPDVMGSTVVFSDIVESAAPGDVVPLFGGPTLAGDALDFSPNASFSAASLDGGASDQTDGQLALTIEAKPGFVIDTIEITEVGFSTLTVAFSGDALTKVESFAVLSVLEVAGGPVAVPADSLFLDFLPDNIFQHSVDSAGEISFTEQWTGAGDFDPDGEVTKVALTVSNNLFAATEGSGTQASASKDNLNIRVTTREAEDNEIPEPTGVLLMVIGAAIVGMFGMNKGANE
ncbi:MAG: hypothetical protein AAGA92_00815 [Planctomycetota bacterium]